MSSQARCGGHRLREVTATSGEEMQQGSGLRSKQACSQAPGLIAELSGDSGLQDD